MSELIEKAIRDQMCKDVDGANFYVNRLRGGQDTSNLIKEVKEIIRKHDLSASEAKGFLEYMKIVIDSSSHLPA